MKKQLTYIAPLRAGVVLGTLYAIGSLLIVPIFLLVTLIGNKAGAPNPAIFGFGLAIALPIIYAIGGFIGGMIAAAIYNLVAQWTGGFEFVLSDEV
jgi:hypothetical protein